MKRLFFLLLLSVQINKLEAQTIHQQAYWFRLYERVRFRNSLVLHVETDYRRLINPDRNWLTFNQLHLHYFFNKKWEVGAAVSYAVVWQGDLPVPEWRPYQLVQYTQPLSKGWILAYRFQFEERFIHRASKTELTEGFGFKMRPRWRVQTSKMINDKWTMRLSEEIFYHLDDGFNQNQVWLSLERQLKNGFSLDIGYLKIWLKRSPNMGYINRDNVRLSVIKNFKVS
jgi:hypothetical protein